jgi:hypothetical protein
MKRMARKLGYGIVGALGLLLAVSLAGCALETGPGDEGHGSKTGTEVDNGTAGGDPTGDPDPVESHVGAGSNTQQGHGGPGNPADPQPSPWIGTGGTDNADQNQDPAAPIDRQQMGTTVEHH